MIANKTAFLVIRLLLKLTYFSDQAAGEHCLFWKKSVRMGESLEEKATQCVCPHSTCLTNDSALCLERSAMI